MRPILFALGALGLLLGTSPAFAEPSSCGIRSAQDILDCVLTHHPDLAVSQAAVERDIELAAVARQRPNPELESKILAGTSSAADDLETETRLLHTVELGGKRKARLREAKAFGEIAVADRQKTREEVALATVLALHRLRQIRTERAYLRESLESFGRILGQLKTRPLLSPEQSVSQSVFEMAAEEYRLKETTLLAEENGLKSSLELATGLPFESLQRHLPAAKTSWPKIGGDGGPAAGAGDLQKAKAETDRASAGLEAAKSLSWPDLKIGPTVQTANPSGAGRTGTSVGGTISLPIPLLSVNGGGRRFAAAEKARAELNLRATNERLAKERQKQVERYRSAVKIFSQFRSRSALGAKHKAVDDLFERGLAPSALVLESHRQMIEIIRSLDEQELAALDALWRIAILDGKLTEAKL
ncbi:MAG TPA: TolC family protein [bacterium]|nr:TolC family protein [bacterium]